MENSLIEEWKYITGKSNWFEFNYILHLLKSLTILFLSDFNQSRSLNLTRKHTQKHGKLEKFWQKDKGPRARRELKLNWGKLKIISTSKERRRVENSFWNLCSHETREHWRALEFDSFDEIHWGNISNSDKVVFYCLRRLKRNFVGIFNPPTDPIIDGERADHGMMRTQH